MTYQYVFQRVENVLKHNEFLLVAGFMMVFIYGALGISELKAPDPNDPFFYMLPAFVAKLLGILGAPPLLVTLKAVNYITMLYALWFYGMRSSRAAAGITLLVIGIYYGMSALGQFVSLGYQESDRHNLIMLVEYFSTLGLILYFLVFDYLKFKLENSETLDEVTIFGFSSMYISLPGVLVLLFSIFLHYKFVSMGMPSSESYGFLVGVAAIILVLSNLVLGLVSAPWYGKSIQFVPIFLKVQLGESTMKNIVRKLILSAVSAAIIGVLAFFAAITVTFIPGVAAFYPATAFEGAFGAWFGIWGAVASYFGLLIAGSLGGWFSLPIGLALSFSDFLMALAPAIAVRKFGLDPEVKTSKAKIYFVLVTLIFGSVPGSLLYNYVNLQLKVIADWPSFWIAVAGWNLGNLVVLVVIGVPLMRFGTKIIKQVDLYVSKLL